MSGTILVKPADGALVRQPDRGNLPIPPEGAIVAENSFYRRAILTGDLIELPEGQAAAATPNEDPSLHEPADPGAEAPKGRRRSASNPDQE